MMSWLLLNDSYLPVIVPVSFITVVILIIVVCVACRRRLCTFKPPPPPVLPQRGCPAVGQTTSSVTTTTYLPGAAPTMTSGTDEYTRCYVSTRRMQQDSNTVDWTGGCVAGHGVVGLGPSAAASSPRQQFVYTASPAIRSDVQYRIYDDC